MTNKELIEYLAVLVNGFEVTRKYSNWNLASFFDSEIKRVINQIPIPKREE